MFVYREQALLNARSSPVLVRHREYERIRYPNVYDSHAEAIKTSAFIGGSKVKKKSNNEMLISVRAQRKDKSSLSSLKSLPGALFTQHHANLFYGIALSHTRLPRVFVFNPVFMMF